MKAPLQPVAATGKKWHENLSLLVRANDWPPHQQVWGGYKITHLLCLVTKNI